MAASLTPQQVAHIAHLARLSLTPDEQEMYAKQLTAILGYVDQLSSIDTESVEPVAQVSGLENVLQVDAIANDPINREAFLVGAPAAQSPYLKVKAVLE